MTRSGFPMRSPVEEPENEAQCEAGDHGGYYRDINTEMVALDDNIPRQATEAQLREYRPKQARCNQDRPEDDQSPAHGLWVLLSTSRKIIEYRGASTFEMLCSHSARKPRTTSCSHSTPAGGA